MSRVLVIDDSEEIQILVRNVLAGLGSRFTAARTLAEAQATLERDEFDLILLDVALPDGDGFEFCSRLQADPRVSRIPVLFLTGNQDVTAKVTAFSLGADDYIVKPFHPLEFKARIEAKLKKIEAKKQEEEVLNRGPLRIDLRSQRVFLRAGGQDKELKLTPREFKILLFLARHEDQVLSREQILEAVWGDAGEVFDRTVDAHVSGLRKKLGKAAHLVESVPGSGYRFNRSS